MGAALHLGGWCETHRFIPCNCPGAIKGKKQHKYNAKPQTIDGIRFDSTKEVKEYILLKRMNDEKIISALEVHPKFDLIAMGGKKVGIYEADFSYISFGQVIVADVKGMITPLAKWKIKHFEIQYGMKVRIV